MPNPGYDSVITKIAEHNHATAQELRTGFGLPWLNITDEEMQVANSELTAGITGTLAASDAVVLETKGDILAGVKKAVTIRRKLNRITKFCRYIPRLESDKLKKGFDESIRSVLDGLANSGSVGELQ